MLSMDTLEFLISYEHLEALGISVGIFLLFLIFRRLFTKYVFRMILRLLNKSKIHLLSTVFRSFQKPMEWLFIIIGLYLALRTYPYFNHEQLWFFRIIKVAIIFLVAWGLLNLFSSSSNLFSKFNEHSNVKIDEILVPLLSKTLQI